MKNYILKREAFLRLVSLALIVVSVFMKEIQLKSYLLFLGIIGLIAVSWAKGQKTVAYIFIFLLVATAAALYFMYFRK